MGFARGLYLSVIVIRGISKGFYLSVIVIRGISKRPLFICYNKGALQEAFICLHNKGPLFI